MRYVGRGEPARPQLTTSAEQMSQMSAGDVVIDATVPDDDGPALPAPFMRSIEDLQTALVVHVGLISDHTATMTAMMARDVVVDAIKDQLSKAETDRRLVGACIDGQASCRTPASCQTVSRGRRRRCMADFEAHC